MTLQFLYQFYSIYITVTSRA